MQLDDKELKELLEEAAEAGASKAIEKLTQDVYQMVGKKVVGKLCQALGMLVVGFVIWALQQGWFK